MNYSHNPPGLVLLAVPATSQLCAISVLSSASRVPAGSSSKMLASFPCPVRMHVCSVVSSSFATPWTVAPQAPLSMGFFRQEHWRGLLFPSPGDLPSPETEHESLHLLHWQSNSLPLNQLGIPFPCPASVLFSVTSPVLWRREWQPTSVFLPREFYGQRSLVGYSPWGHKELDTTEHSRFSPPVHHLEPK